MTKSPLVQTTLAFGMFGGQWCWRVEWTDKKGKSWFQDFPQRDLRPGEAKRQADEMVQHLKAGTLAA